MKRRCGRRGGRYGGRSLGRLAGCCSSRSLGRLGGCRGRRDRLLALALARRRRTRDLGMRRRGADARQRPRTVAASADEQRRYEQAGEEHASPGAEPQARARRACERGGRRAGLPAASTEAVVVLAQRPALAATIHPHGLVIGQSPLNGGVAVPHSHHRLAVTARKVVTDRAGRGQDGLLISGRPLVEDSAWGRGDRSEPGGGKRAVKVRGILRVHRGGARVISCLGRAGSLRARSIAPPSGESQDSS